MPLDLDEGDEQLAEATPAERRRAARAAADEGGSDRSKKKSTSSRSRASVQERVEVELASRLDRTFDRIAAVLQQRGDHELADVINEDKGAMSQGLVSLTRSVKLLRSPLLMSLNLIEPALAFGRIGRTLYVRFAERQARIAMERDIAAQEAASSPVAATQ
jgi:hypothetical protein